MDRKRRGRGPDSPTPDHDLGHEVTFRLPNPAEEPQIAEERRRLEEAYELKRQWWASLGLRPAPRATFEEIAGWSRPPLRGEEVA